jgi:hypothetical protein
MDIDERFVVNLQGKDFVTYAGLLDLAHQKGLKSIEVDVLQFPTKENNMTAICKATAKTKDEIYTDIGDANPQSVNKNIAPHLIRMASTRAKARALRDLTNIGMTALEELGDDDVIGSNSNNKSKTADDMKLRCSRCGVEIAQGVAAYSKKNFGRKLCMSCQKEFKKAN